MRAAILKAAAITALIAAAAATPAFAQDSGNDSATETSAAEPSISSDNVTETADKPATKSGAATLNTNTTTPLTTSSASLPGAVKAAQPRSVFAEFYSETYMPMGDFERGRGRATLNSYGGVKFDLGNTNSISLRQNFDFISTAADNGGNFKIQDTVVNFTRGKLAEFKDGSTLTLIARAYAPTGENSRATGQQAQERLYLIGSKSLGKFDFTYVLLGRLFQQGRDYNLNEKGEAVQTNAMALTNELDIFYNVNAKVAFGLIFGMDNIARNRAPGKSTSVDDMYFQPTIQVAPVKGLTLQALLYNEMNIRNPSQDHRLFRGSETQVAFNVAAQL